MNIQELKNKKYLISIILFLGGQAFMYAFLKIFQTNPHYINCVLDTKIPFIGYFIYIYNMFYPFMFLFLTYMYLKDKEKYFKGIIAGTIGFLICDIIFLSYPTIMAHSNILNYDFLTNLVLKITYAVDSPAVNCFPSIHCLFGFQVMFTYIASKKVENKAKIIANISFFLVIISTLFVKQHYVYDVISAFLICGFSNFVVYKFNIYEKYFKKICE